MNIDVVKRVIGGGGILFLVSCPHGIETPQHRLRSFLRIQTRKPQCTALN
jgi:hypothetical protein